MAVAQLDREKAVRYARTREALFVVSLLYGWAVEAGFLFSGSSARLRDLSLRWGRRVWLADAIHAGAWLILSQLLTLPLAYVRDYVVEHRFGLSNQGHRGWLVDLAKGAGLGLAFQAPLSAAVYAVIRRSPRRWWLILSGLALPFTVVLAQLYPVLIAPIFNKFVPLPDAALAERVRALAERAGVRVADVMQMDMSRQTRKANAFFAGMGRTKRIALGDTLVNEMTPDEVEVVVAHELAHQVRGDVWKGVALGSLATLGGAYLLSRVAPGLIERTRARTGVRGLDDPAGAPLLGLLLGIVSVGTMPLANWFSREMVERPADRYALELTGKREAFVSAMEKLARQNLSDPEPPWLVKVLLYSHPPVAERIAAAR